MLIRVNGRELEVKAATVAALLAELNYANKIVATALNEEFVRASARATTPLHDGDALEILTPRQGG